VEQVNFTGHQINLLDLKRSILELKRMTSGLDFDLKLTDAENSSKVYIGDESFVPKNTTVVVKRVPVPSGTGLLSRLQGSQSRSSHGTAQKQEHAIVIPPKSKPQPSESEPAPLSAQQQDSGKPATTSEAPAADVKPEIKPSSEQSAEEEMLALQSLSQKAAPRYQRSGGNMVWSAEGDSGTGLGTSESSSVPRGVPQPARRPPTTAAPPPGYECKRCGKPGHYIKHCPTNGDPAYDRRTDRSSDTAAVSTSVAKIHGVPTNSIQYVKDLAGVNTTGKIVRNLKDGFEILDADKDSYATLVKQGGSTSSAASLDLSSVPAHLLCPYSQKILRDAVTLPCCGKVVSDGSIRAALFQTSNFQCPMCHQVGITPDELRPQHDTRRNVEEFIARAVGGPDSGPGSEEKESSVSKAPAPPPPSSPPVRHPQHAPPPVNREHMMPGGGRQGYPHNEPPPGQFCPPGGDLVAGPPPGWGPGPGGMGGMPPPGFFPDRMGPPDMWGMGMGMGMGIPPPGAVMGRGGGGAGMMMGPRGPGGGVPIWEIPPLTREAFAREQQRRRERMAADRSLPREDNYGNRREKRGRSRSNSSSAGRRKRERGAGGSVSRHRERSGSYGGARSTSRRRRDRSDSPPASRQRDRENRGRRSESRTDDRRSRRDRGKSPTDRSNSIDKKSRFSRGGKERDRERERERVREKERERDRAKERDRDKSRGRGERDRYRERERGTSESSRSRQKRSRRGGDDSSDGKKDRTDGKRHRGDDRSDKHYDDSVLSERSMDSSSKLKGRAISVTKSSDASRHESRSQSTRDRWAMKRES